MHGVFEHPQDMSDVMGAIVAIRCMGHEGGCQCTERRKGFRQQGITHRRSDRLWRIGPIGPGPILAGRGWETIAVIHGAMVRNRDLACLRLPNHVSRVVQVEITMVNDH